VGNLLIFKFWLILMVTNGTPMLAAALWPGLRRRPVDNGRRLADGQPLLGHHKTWGGLLSGILAGGLCGGLMGLSLPMSSLIAGTSMLGDLFTSFLKRRMGFKEGDFPCFFANGRIDFPGRFSWPPCWCFQRASCWDP